MTKRFTTTDAGIPAPSDEQSLTIGPDGPILLQDHYLIEQMAQFNRERIPERQPHAKAGCIRPLRRTATSASKQGCGLPTGTKTDTLISSPPSPANAAAQTPAGPRGFALKFYTTEGNFDMVATTLRSSSCGIR